MEFLLTLLLLGNSCEELKYCGVRDPSCYRVEEGRDRMAVIDLQSIWCFFCFLFLFFAMFFEAAGCAHRSHGSV